MAAQLPIMSAALHAYAVPAAASEAPVTEFAPELGPEAARTRIVDRVQGALGITLTTAPVVVSGGRGVGSEEGFAAIEELAELLGAAVGCSRVVTNQGWRPHADQVGQTGKRVAPDLYIACGISGAIQHWVGMQAAKHVLAINTDPDAPMVTKADYAVIGDLHEIVPAIVEELRRRRA
jgi:electron transfer flavoprotein alpha subunit